MSNYQYRCVAANSCGSATSDAAKLTVNARPITITPTAGLTKVYGTADPILTYTASEPLQTGDSYTGVLGRAPGNNVNTYAYTLNTLSAGDNYALSLGGSNTFTITPKTLTVTADAGQTKVYGDANPTAYTYAATGFEFSDGLAVMTGALARLAGEDVGSYAINQGTLSAGANYSISYTGANFTITPKTLTVTADAGQTKVYGDANPTAYTYAATGFEFSDGLAVMTGALARLAGEDVGSYAINQGTLSAGANYSISYTGANFTITPKTLTVTADAGQTKVYGDANPTAYTYAATGFEFSDGLAVMTGALARLAGEDVGSYAINQGTLSAGANYSISYTGANFTITPKTLTVTADAGQTKVYGDANPTAYTYAATGFEFSDGLAVMTGALARLAGEDVGSYAINQGTLSAGANYSISYTGANFTITPKTLTVTADAGQTKVYGDANPTAYTYAATGFEFSDGLAVMTGALARLAGEDVGSYAINQGTLSAGANYSISYTGANFTITPKTLTVTADAGQTKVYGDANPTAYTYAATGFEFSDGLAVMTGALARLAGEDVGSYAINQGTLSAGANYSISYTGANFTITPKTLTVTADAGQTKVYGDANPTAYTYAATGFEFSDGLAVMTGALARLAGEDVGSYAINQGTLSAGANYSISYTGANFTITPKTLTVTADAGQTKVYGDANPTAYTYAATGFEFSDGLAVMTGALARLAGEDVGSYAINQGTLSAGANYSISYTGANFTITPKTLTVTADAGQTKVYGDANPTAYTYAATGFEFSDGLAVMTGALARLAGEDVGSYAINQGTLSAGANYSISYTGANFTITPKTLTVTADAGQTKVYGDANPTAYTYAATGFEFSDGLAVMTGALARLAGEDVGSYAINQGTLSAGANYSISYTGANFTITPKTLTVTADAGQTKVYGDANPTAYTYAATGFEFSDGLAVMTGALARLAGEDVGSYAINQGTLSAGANYSISYTGANFTITPKTLTVTADAGQTKVYGDANPTAYTYAATGFEFSDGLAVMTGALARLAGEDVGSYAINQGTLSAGANYSISYTGANFTITPKTLTVTADAGQTKVYGDANPTAYTYAATGFEFSDGLAVMTGALARLAGEDVGSYAINQGTLSAGANYSISYTGANFTITPKTLTVTADAGQTKVYGDANPTAYTYAATGFEFSDGLAVMTGALARLAGEDVGSYAINQGTLSAGANYSISYTGANFTITPKTLTVTADAGQTKVYGDANPTAYTYAATGFEFSDGLAVMTGALARLAGEDVGSYAINQGTLSAGANYSISYTGANFTITPKTLTVTADAGQTKVYGDANPTAYTYAATGFEFSDGLAVMTGALARLAGEDVGSYAINQGTLSAGANYSISYTGANFTITPKTLTVTADAGQTKVYGDANPTAYTYAATGFEFSDGLAVMTGALARLAGEDVGSYAINQGTLSAGANYSISYTGANFTITPKTLTVTADAGQTKVYGDANPTAYTYAATGFEFSDGLAVMTGALARLAGEDVGSYAINQGTLSAGANYSISYTGANFTITPKTLTVTADAGQTKVYGDANPTAYTYAATGFEFSDGLAVMTGALARLAGEDVGSYAINQGTLSAGANYSISYTGANFTITPKTLTVTADAGQTKVYGDANPTAYTYAATGFEFSDGLAVMTGALARLAGEDVGSYAINQGTLSAGANYSISYTGANFTITPKTLTVTADAGQTKVYGDANPTAYTYAATGFEFSDGLAVMTGALARLAGEDVGSYAINQGTLSAGANYSISYTGANFTITPKTLTVTADAGQTKVYGDANPTAYTYAATGFEFSDGLAVMTGALARLAGEDVGSYAINQGTLSAGANYSISYTGANFTITPKTLTVTADAGQTKVYGDANPTAYTYAATGFEFSDGLAVMTGALARLAGEDVGSYAINQGTLSAGANYSISYTGANFTITPKTLTVTADAGQTKVYGDANPTAYTYAATGFEFSDGLAVMTGALARLAGEDVGSYAINQGTLSAGANYSISYTGANFTITPKTLTVTADAGQTKVYGDANPTAYTYAATGFEFSDGLAVMTGALARLAGEDVGSYAINQGTLSAGANYSISYTGANFTITPKTLTVTADAGQTKVYGDANPTAYTYAATGFEFSDGLAVMTGALARLAGEDVGSYAINQGTLSAGANYSISYTGANFTITPKTLTVTADAGQTKVYGDANPTAYTYAATGFEFSDGLAVMTGALARLAGEDVGSYAINQGTLSAGANYSISYTGANFTITPKTLTVTADAGQTKVYGDANPTAYTYAATGFEFSDGLAVMTGALARLAGEDVGSYAINQGTLSAGANYSISYTGANFTITPKTLTVTADAGQTKVYGDANPTAYTYAATGFEFSDGLAVMTGALARLAGEDVGSYAINQGTLSAGANYSISYTGANFTITPKTLTVTADAGQTKVYGDANPTAYTYAATGFEFSDGLAVMTGALARLAGEDVGSYAINQGTLSAGANYSISYTGANFTITPKTLTVTADAGQTKVYGDANPTAYTYAATGFEFSDGLAVMTGALARLAGEDVGSYAINQGTLSAGANYSISYTGANFTITPKTLTVTADAGQTKVYGDANPTAYTYAATGFEFSDGLAVMTGALARLAGEDVGSYAINQGTLSAGANYSISYTGANFTITPKTLTVTADAGQTKVYGDANPTAYTYAATGFEFSDGLAVMTGALARLAGEDVGSYAINQGTLSAGANYSISYTGANFTITPKTLTVTADAGQTKVYGDANPTAYTYAATGFEFSDGLAVMTGALARLAGEDVGSYAINQGTLSAGANYSISYTGANFTITPKTLTVTADAGQTKVYGDANPTAYTYAATGFEFSDGLAVMTGALARLAGEDVGSYAINQGTLSAGANYSISYTGANFTITPKTLTVTADAKSKYCGQVDPALTYQITSGTLAFADAFTGALTRDAGESSGTSYAILQGSVALSANYELSYVGANLIIKRISVDASASSSPVQKGSPKGLTATVTPSISGDVSGIPVTFIVTNEADGGVFTETVVTNSSGVAITTVPSIAIPTVGVYKIVVTAGSGCAESTAYFPVFDPTESFVTGGGWINSPKGALAGETNYDVIGKANFGFVSKYKKGKTLTTEVDGNTEFQFQAGNINFKSTMHEAGSLVISGGKATYRGTGTINGSGIYKFLIVAIDGDWNGGTSPDKFRIKISTTSGGVVYDNQMGIDENNADATVLGNNGTGGGSIVIHEVKAVAKKAAFIEPEVVVVEPTVKAYPNPFTYRLNIEFSSATDGMAKLEIYGVTGAKLATLWDAPVSGGVLNKVEFVPNLVSSQMVFYHLTMNGKTQVGKVVFQERR